MLQKLLYDNIEIGELDLFNDDALGAGDFIPGPALKTDPKLQRVQEYIEFCEEWDRQAKAGNPDFESEIDRYADLHEAHSWQLLDSKGKRTKIFAPIFTTDGVFWGTVSWRPLLRSPVLLSILLIPIFLLVALAISNL